MRIVLLLALVVPSWSVLSAQSPVAKGVWTIGGSARMIGFHDDANDVNEVGFELAPQIGYFPVTGLAVSGNLLFGWSKRDRSGRTVVWGLGPGISYYLRGVSPRIFPFASFRYLFTRSSFRPSSDAPALSPIVDTDQSWRLGGGAAFFLARNVAVTAEAFFSRAHFKARIGEAPTSAEQRNSSTQYGLAFGVQAFVF
jgi:hypothetical protein